MASIHLEPEIGKWNWAVRSGWFKWRRRECIAVRAMCLIPQGELKRFAEFFRKEEIFWKVQYAAGKLATPGMRSKANFLLEIGAEVLPSLGPQAV